MPRHYFSVSTTHHGVRHTLFGSFDSSLDSGHAYRHTCFHGNVTETSQQLDYHFCLMNLGQRCIHRKPKIRTPAYLSTYCSLWVRHELDSITEMNFDVAKMYGGPKLTKICHS